MALQNALTLKRGNTLVINYTNQDNTPVAQGGPQPISLSGATIYFTVKVNPGWDTTANDSSAIWQLTSTGNTGNTCTFTSTPVETWVNPQTYAWDITVDYGSGNVITTVSGTIQIIGTPTNKAS